MDEFSLNTYKAGILEPYRTYLRYAQITDLGHALRTCRHYDNDRMYEQYMDQLRGTPKQDHPQVMKFNNVTPLPNVFRGQVSNPYAIASFSPYFQPRAVPPPQRSPMPNVQNHTSNYQPRLSQPVSNHQTRFSHPRTTSQSPRFSSHQDTPAPRPPTQTNRHYPTPGAIGRRFMPQEQTNFPKPMSGVSTIRQNVNSHIEYDEAPLFDTPFSEEPEKLHKEHNELNYKDSYDYNYCNSYQEDQPLFQNVQSNSESNPSGFSANPIIIRDDLNNIYNASQLPFITLFGLKILIDSGARNSMMNPSIAYSLFSNCIFKEPFCIQSVHAQTLGNDNVQFPIFSEYHLETPVNFRVMKWHRYFDALIGTADFVRLGAKIDYKKNIITLGDRDIPFYLHSPFRQNDFKTSQNPQVTAIPVNIKEGDVYVSQFEHCGVSFHDAILHAKDYQVLYPIETHVNVEFKEPVFVEPLDSIDTQALEIKSVSDKDIREYLRTQHANALEQKEIDRETVHSNQEDPIFTLKMSERNLNMNRNQIIVKFGDSPKLLEQKLFKKHTRHTMIITQNNLSHDLETLLLKVITPSNKYAVHFKDITLEIPFIRSCQKLFTSELIIIRSQEILEDVEEPEKQKQLILQYHTINHNGISETITHLQTKYYWPHLREHVRILINECNLCQRNKYERHPNQVEDSGPIVADHPFAQIHIDTFHFEQIRILTILDVFSKYGQAYILPNGSALAVLHQLQLYFSHHGLPKKITHDQGGEFENNLIKEYCKSFNIEYHATTPLNSQSNSPVERFNSTILEKLRISRDQDKFSPFQQIMTNVIFNYNSSIHSAVKKPPYNILYGPYYDALEHIFSPSPKINEYIQRQSDQLRSLREKNPEPVTTIFEHSYKIGDLVYVTNPLTRNKKSKNLFNEGTVVKLEGNKIHCKMRNGKIHVRSFRDIKPKRKPSYLASSSRDSV